MKTKLGRPFADGNRPYVRTTICLEPTLMADLKKMAGLYYNGHVSALMRDVLGKQITKWQKQQAKK